MTGRQLKNARRKLGLTQAEFAVVLGYGGNSARIQIWKMEVGDRPVPASRRILVELYLKGHRPDNWPKHKRSLQPCAV